MFRLWLSVVIPSFKSSESLPELVSRLHSTVSEDGRKFEIIIVDDCSPDSNKTWEAINNLAQNFSEVRGFRMQFNTGQFLASLAGMNKSLGEYVVTIDDDLEFAPEDIPNLVQTLENDPMTDVAMAVVKSRSYRKNSLLRTLGSSLVALTFSLFHNKPKGVKLTSFAAYRRTLVDTMVSHTSRRPILGAVTLSSTQRITPVEVTHSKRKYGVSGYSTRRLIRSTFDNVFYSTTAPLRMFSVIGGLIAIASISFSGYLLYWRFTADSPMPGFTTIGVLISFIGGMLMLGLGLIGEYIDRLISETSGKPRWHIAEMTTENGEDE